MNIGAAIAALVDLGVFPVIALATLIGLSVNLYRRFRSGGSVSAPSDGGQWYNGKTYYSEDEFLEDYPSGSTDG